MIQNFKKMVIQYLFRAVRFGQLFGEEGNGERQAEEIEDNLRVVAHK